MSVKWTPESVENMVAQWFILWDKYEDTQRCLDYYGSELEAFCHRQLDRTLEELEGVEAMMFAD